MINDVSLVLYVYIIILQDVGIIMAENKYTKKEKKKDKTNKK